MQKKISCQSRKIMVLVLLFSCLATPASAQPVESTSLTIDSDAGSRTVQAVYVDLNDPGVKLQPVLGQNQIGLTESLADMAERSGAAAAINGTFFNAYSDMQPQGNIQIDGIFHYLSNSGSSIGITAGNQVRFGTVRCTIDGRIDGPAKKNLPAWDEYKKNWYAWDINRINSDPEAITIFTPAKGTQTGVDTGTSVVVDNGLVAAIKQGEAAIPANGFVINFGPAPAAQKYVGYFQVGDTVSYQVKFTENGSPAAWSDVRHTLGAGPILVRNGEASVDLPREGMDDPKLTTSAGARSFVGLTRDNRLVMGTVGNVTIRQLAQITQKMGLVQAMNLDGGASSGLYYEGEYLTAPGRNLSNCLVVKYEGGPVAVILDGQSLVFDVPPRMESNRILVPIRKIGEAMGAKVDWNEALRLVTLTLDQKTIKLVIDSQLADVDGHLVQLDVPARTIDGRTLVPLRFVSESLGADVNWDESSRTVTIKTLE